MSTRETELPGVGTKFSIDLESGAQVVVVEHRSGRWELARIDADGRTAPLVLLQPKEAAELGRILSHGEIIQEDPRKQMLFAHIGIEWAELGESSPLVGQTLASSGIRERSGANVIAVLRGGEALPSPRPDTVFQAGDTLVLIGQREQLDRFLEDFGSHTSGS
ncbi:MAG: cation:proton antiporter regulatory subunit [Myxococcota bacterium]